MAQTDGKPEAFDSDRQYIGTVYAKALLGATGATGNSESVLAELDSLIEDVLNTLPRLESLLSSPRVPQPDKVSLLDKAFRGKVSQELLNFLKVVVGHGRFDCLRAVRRAARRLYNEARGRVSGIAHGRRDRL